MRHLIKGRKLGRTASHRKATLSALAVALIHERRITTTIQKAKELRSYVEPLITRAKVDSTHNRRQVFSKLNDKYAVTELFEEVGPKAKDRPGGYTRVLKIGFRQGDATEMAVIELVDYNDTPPEVIDGKKKRTRRAGKSKKTTPADPAAKTGDTETDAKQEGNKIKQPETTKAEQPEEVQDIKEQQQDTAEEKSEAEGNGDVTTSQAKSESSESAADFNVDEVKQKLEDMDVEEAKAFVGNDERVTVQRALQKKIDDLSSDENASEEEK